MEGKILDEFVNKEYLNEGAMQKLHEDFKEASPFKHLEIDNFFHENILLEVIDALQDEHFERKDSDLFQFLQTDDLENSNSKFLRDFKKFLMSEDFMIWMETVSGLRLKRNKVDLTANLYSDTDYLLCHDDQIPGRKIAFIIYLSDLEQKEGGTLNFFDCVGDRPARIVKSIRPEFNKFVFFEVTPHSFHEVDEVVGETFRATLTGWFHAAE
ncbi:MAG: hypothetical protein D6732_01480 [Methanobacteriota archaeon]|nr:MAG: hypothetical protein D6732_01480 [Euryarchaeota archaeon]